MNSLLKAFGLSVTIILGLVWSLLGTTGKTEPLPRSDGQYPSWGNWCGIEIQASTAEREVYGTNIAVECGDCSLPSAPFGNWGVDSFFSNRVDGSQYKGWATQHPACSESMDDPEWNSCTRDYTGAACYNSDPPVQYSPSETNLGTVWDWYSTTEEDGCLILDGAQIAGGTTLEIWELDHWGPWDDHVTDLQVSSGAALLACSREGCTPVDSDWGNGSNGVTSANFRIRVMSSCAYIEGKGCI